MDEMTKEIKKAIRGKVWQKRIGFVLIGSIAGLAGWKVVDLVYWAVNALR